MTARARTLRAVAATAALLLAGCSSGGASDGADPGPAERSTTTTGASTTTGDADRTTTTTAPEASPASVADFGTFAVGTRRFDLVDDSRDTSANGGAAGSEGRALPTTAWYPTEGAGSGAEVPESTEGADPLEGRYPLVVFSHGVTARGTDYTADLTALASAGYVVIAPDYPLSNRNSPGGPTIADVGNQPADASYLIDRFTDPDGDEAAVAELAAHVDPDRIGAAGHSLGAITTLGLAYGAPHDDRIDAAVAWAGILLPMQGGPAVDPEVTDVPLLMVHGTDDGTLAHGLGELAFDSIHVPRWFVTLPGAGHVPPYIAGLGGDDTTRLVISTALDFFDAELKDDPDGIERLEQAVADAGPDLATLQTATG